MREQMEDNRVFSIIKRDTYNDPEKILPSLKRELRQVAEDFVVLDGDVKLRYKLTPNGYLFMVEFPASSIKNLFYF